MLNPLPQYESYFCNNDCSRLIGIDKDGLHEIKITESESLPIFLKDFFIKEKIMYLKASIQEDTGTLGEPKIESVIHFYSQKNNKVKEIESLPEKPAIDYSTYASKHFTIEKGNYKELSISRILNLKMKNQVVFKQIFGFCEVKSGLYFNVIESMIPGKAEGLYFYQVDRKAVGYLGTAFGLGFLW